MRNTTAFFIDFDGVICDSYVECFSMSWYAFHIKYLENGADAMLIADKARFRELRPMVRNSEDNMVIQHILNAGARVSSQEDFDRVCSDLSPGTLRDFRDCFYKTREFFLAEYRDFWLDLNVIFKPFIRILEKTANNPAVFILSTKKPSFIDEILKHNGLSWEFGRILEPGPGSKENIIKGILESGGFRHAIFLDDQIDHLRFKDNTRITGYLAEWGYVSADARNDFSVPHVALEDCEKLFSDFV